jgi:hypothetical protein
MTNDGILSILFLIIANYLICGTDTFINQHKNKIERSDIHHYSLVTIHWSFISKIDEQLLLREQWKNCSK